MAEPQAFKYLTDLEIAIGAVDTLWPYLAFLMASAAAALIWLKKMGWIHIGKELERRRDPPCSKFCGDHGALSVSVTQIGTRVNGLEHKIDKVDEKITKNSQDLNRLIGKIDALHGHV